MKYLFLFLVSLFALTGMIGKVGTWFGIMPTPGAERAAIAEPAATAKPARKGGGDIMYVARGSNGHFGVDGVIGGRRVSFLVDTGASIVALTAEDAARLNITPSMYGRALRIQTANGVIAAKRVRLAAIQVGPLEVQDIEAVVMPRGRLAKSLLGMTFLSRLRRYEFRSGQLVMEQ
jgi:aspartyl protease family protein